MLIHSDVFFPLQQATKTHSSVLIYSLFKLKYQLNLIKLLFILLPNPTRWHTSAYRGNTDLRLRSESGSNTTLLCLALVKIHKTVDLCCVCSEPPPCFHWLPDSIDNAVWS